MKSTKYFMALAIGLLLAFSAYASADGDHNTVETDNHMSYDRDSFAGFSDNMNIVGNLTIQDSILISLAVFPSNDMMNEMQEDEMQEMYQLMNRMDVKITKLVEYDDLQNDGLTADDITISEYQLSSVTISQPQIIENGTSISYEASSINSSVFKISLEVLSQEGIPSSIKWSYEINYPFLQTNSSIAVIHDINSMDTMEFRGDMMNEENSGMGIGEGNNGEHMSSDMDSYMGQSFGNMETDMDINRMMSDKSGEMPMEFTWNKTAVVDGLEVDIFSTELDSSLALSFPQGDKISYDPKLSVDISSLQSADIRVGELMETNYTVLIAVVSGLIAISALIIFLRRNNSSIKLIRK